MLAERERDTQRASTRLRYRSHLGLLGRVDEAAAAGDVQALLSRVVSDVGQAMGQHAGASGRIFGGCGLGGVAGNRSRRKRFRTFAAYHGCGWRSGIPDTG